MNVLGVVVPLWMVVWFTVAAAAELAVLGRAWYRLVTTPNLHACVPHKTTGDLTTYTYLTDIKFNFGLGSFGAVCWPVTIFVYLAIGIAWFGTKLGKFSFYLAVTYMRKRRFLHERIPAKDLRK